MDEEDFSTPSAKVRLDGQTSMEELPSASFDDMDDLYGTPSATNTPRGQNATNVTSNAATPAPSPCTQDGLPTGGIPGLFLLARPAQEFYDNAANRNVNRLGDSERSDFHPDDVLWNT